MTMPDTSLPETRRPTAREQVREIKDQAIGQARDTFRQARDSAASSLGDSKTRFADQVGGIASAFRQASEQLRGGEQARIAGLTDSLAQHVDQVASYLRDRDATAMRDDLEQLARRQPALVIGGAFALGLLTARFLKSSERRERASAVNNSGYDGGAGGGADGGFDGGY